MEFLWGEPRYILIYVILTAEIFAHELFRIVLENRKKHTCSWTRRGVDRNHSALVYQSLWKSAFREHPTRAMVENDSDLRFYVCDVARDGSQIGIKLSVDLSIPTQ